jgi:hypothetical protein
MFERGEAGGLGACPHKRREGRQKKKRFLPAGLVEGFSDQSVFSLEPVAEEYGMYGGFSLQSIGVVVVRAGKAGAFSGTVLLAGVDGPFNGVDGPFNGVPGTGGLASLSVSSSETSSIAQQASSALLTFQKTFWCMTSGLAFWDNSSLGAFQHAFTAFTKRFPQRAESFLKMFAGFGGMVVVPGKMSGREVQRPISSRSMARE